MATNLKQWAASRSGKGLQNAIELFRELGHKAEVWITEKLIEARKRGSH
jgi:hypothetical protein